MAQLPQELIFETLLRLPVKSLLRFQSLSKPLSAVITSPDFINSHLTRYSQNPNNLHKLIFRDPFSENFRVCDVNLDVEEDIIRLENPFLFPQRIVYGDCKGLILLPRTSLSYEFGFTLWNPSTREIRDLPEGPFRVRSKNPPLKRLLGLGLGYDDSICDCKAFFVLHVQPQFESEFEVQVWVYELRPNVWRRVRDFPYPVDRMGVFCEYPRIGCFADGSVYWLCMTKSDDVAWSLDVTTEIMSFDVRNEIFSVELQPDCLINSRGLAPKRLHVLDGCLCISYFCIDRPCRAELYMRKKDGDDRFSWAKLYSVVETNGMELHPCTEPILPGNCSIDWFRLVKVLGYSKRGDKILLHLRHLKDDKVGMVVSYDLGKKSIKKVEIDIAWNPPIIGLEVESPVSLRHRAA